MEKRETSYAIDKSVTLAIFGVCILLIILIFANILVARSNLRWDITEEKIFSLSEGSQKILSNLNEPINIKFFYSGSNKKMPIAIKLYASRVKDFLSEYKYSSNGMITVDEIDPSPDSNEEELAQRYDIEALSIDGGDNIYFGMVFIAADKEASMPVINPSREKLLEYDITKLIQRVHNPKKITIGIMSDLPVFGGVPPGMPAMMGEGNRKWLFVEELEKSYNVRNLPPDTEKIPDDIDLLMVIHPRSMGDEQQFAIDQYVLSGKNLIAVVDPYSISDPMSQLMRGMPQTSSLDKLFSAWGLHMDVSKLIIDMDQPTKLRGEDGGIEDNPSWISPNAESFDKDSIISARIERMLFPLAGVIEKTPDSSVDFNVLVHSSTNAGTLDLETIQKGVPMMRRVFVPSNEHLAVAVQIRGAFETAFPAGPPPKEDKEDGETENELPVTETSLKNSKGISTVVVISDADFLFDDFYVQRGSLLGVEIAQVFNDNLNFLSNATEVLTGSDELISLRTRGTYERPFTVVMKLEKEAQMRWLAKEKELEQRSEEATIKLRNLEQQKSEDQKLIISPEQEAEIARFKEERRRINKELKEVRKNLRYDIERLGAIVKIINLTAIPLCVAISGVLFAIYRQRRNKRK